MLNVMLRFCYKGNFIGSFIIHIMGWIIPCSALHMKGLRPSHLAPYQWGLSCPVVYIPTQSASSSPFGPPKFHFSNWSGLPSDQMNPSSTSEHGIIAFIGYILEYHFRLYIIVNLDGASILGNARWESLTSELQKKCYNLTQRWGINLRNQWAARLMLAWSDCIWVTVVTLYDNYQ